MLRTALLITVLWTSLASGWQVDLRGSHRRAVDRARSVVRLADGDFVVAGQLAGRLTVLRLDASSGAIEWQRDVPLDDLGYGGCYAFSPIEDRCATPLAAQGNTVVVAAGGKVSRFDATSGAIVWTHAITGGAFGALVHDLALDAAGHVAVAGAILESDGQDETSFLAVLLDGQSGAERWRHVLAGTPSPEYADDFYERRTADVARAVVIDPAGNVLVGGTVVRRGIARMTVLAMRGATGDLAWRGDAGRGRIERLVIDAGGDVVVAGWADRPGFTVRKLAARTGRRRWRRDVTVAGVPPARLLAGLEASPGGDTIAIADLGDAGVAARLEGRRGRIRWQRTFDAGDAVWDVAPAGGDDLAVAGAALSGEGNAELLVLRLAGDTGATRWRRTVAAATPAESIARGVAVAADGSVVAVGETPRSPSDPDLIALRLAAADGATEWERIVDGIPGGDDLGYDVTTVPGAVLAAGRVDNDEGIWDFAVVRLDAADGSEIWRNEINGESGRHPIAADVALRVAVHPSGDVVAAGEIERQVTAEDLAVIRVDRLTGAERWRTLFAGTRSDESDTPRALVVSPDGDVIVGGYLLQDFGVPLCCPEFFVAKLDGDDGTERWRRTVLLPYGEAASVAVDSAGDVVVAGVASFETGPDFLVVKLDGTTGDERWRVRLDGGDGAFEQAYALALDAAGDVIAAGRVSHPGTAGDLVVVKLSGATGAEQWRQTVDGPAHGIDAAQSLALDGAGGVLVAGVLDTGPGLWTLVALRVDAANGNESWQRVVGAVHSDVLPSVALTADAAGDAYVTGSVDDVHGLGDLLVAKLANADGAERWRRVVAGTGAGADLGSAIAIGAEGYVAVTGYLTNLHSGRDFTVLTLDAADGTDWLGAL